MESEDSPVSKQDGSSRLDAEALEGILEVTRALARPLDLETMLEHVIEAGRSILDADRGTVFLYEEEKGELVSKVATGTGELRVPADKGIVGECVRTRQVINVPDCYADSRFNRAVDVKTGYRTRCMMTIPLIGHDDSLEGVLQVLNKKQGTFSDQDEQVATALGAQCAVALQRVRMLDELLRKKEMEQELDVARRIQMRVLPQIMPRVEGYDLFGWSRAAQETGGDIFDIIRREDGVILMLGDATGHGIGPALSVTQVRAMLRMCILLEAGIDDAMQLINNQLADDLSSRRFVTVFMGSLDAKSHRVTYHSGGQGPMLHFHAAGQKAEWLDSSTRPLGIFGGLPLGESRSLDLAPGDLLVTCTDGIFEYADPSEEQYGQERMAEVVQRHQNDSAEEIVQAIVASVDEFARGASQDDDMTILVVRRLADD